MFPRPVSESCKHMVSCNAVRKGISGGGVAPGGGVNPGDASGRPGVTKLGHKGIDQAAVGGFLLGMNQQRKEERPPVTELRTDGAAGVSGKDKDDG